MPQIGTIGKGVTLEPCDRDPYFAHLHFEIRKNYLSPSNWLPMVKDYNQVGANYYDPSNFIDSHRPQIFPLVGDWDGNGIDSTGTFNPRTSIFSLKNETDDEIVNQQFGEPGDLPIVGDWNKDGNDSIGVYRPKTAEFYFDDDNDGTRDYDPINFGEIGDYPIIGDWDGDGKDNIGVFRSSDSLTPKTTFFLKYPGKTETIEFGMPTDFPIVGDWNNDGKDDIGIFRRYDPDHDNNAVFYLKNGDEVINITYGNNNDIPIVGRPKVDKLTRIGVYRPSTQEFLFKIDPIFNPQKGKLDVVILVDTTSSMGPYIDAAKASASEIVEALDSKGLDYRVAIVDYRDYPQYPYGGSMDYVYNLDLPFSSDKGAIIYSINGLYLGWGADWREAVYSALVMSMTDVNKDITRADNYGWRHGAIKVIIIMGDAPPHIPEPWPGGHTLEEVIAESKEIDPVIIHSIVVGSDPTTRAAFAEISEGTGGKVYSSPTADGVVKKILEAIEDIGNEQDVHVSINPSYSEASPGGSVAYSVNITNTGDKADIYDISFEAENIAGSYRGYPLAIQYSWITFDNSSVELDPSMSESRPLLITIPENWAGMENVTYIFSVRAESETDEAVGNTSSAELKVKADKRSMVEYSKLEIQWLSELIENSGTDCEIKNALLPELSKAELKLDQALGNLDGDKVEAANGDLRASLNMMGAFNGKVDAQDGKKITQPSAEDLKQKADQIMEDIRRAGAESL